MRRVILYIAASLDGYIAGENGGIDWLDSEAAPDDAGNGYEAFLREIDTIVMGYNTYRQVTEELSPGKWVYAGKKTYVLTHRGIANLPEIQFVCQPVERLIETLRQEGGKGIWICGGAKIIHPLLQQNLIDEFRITIIPILLGRGIPPLWSAGLPDSFAVDLYPKERQLVGADLSPARPGERGKMI